MVIIVSGIAESMYCSLIHPPNILDLLCVGQWEIASGEGQLEGKWGIWEQRSFRFVRASALADLTQQKSNTVCSFITPEQSLPLCLVAPPSE